MGTDLASLLSEGLTDLQTTAGVSITVRRDGHTATITGTITPGAASYRVEMGGNLYDVVATAIIPRGALATLEPPKVGDRVAAAGGASYRVTGVRGSTVDPAWHLDLGTTAAF